MTLSPTDLSRAAEIRTQTLGSPFCLAVQIVLLQDIRALLQPVEAGVRAVADHILRAAPSEPSPMWGTWDTSMLHANVPPQPTESVELRAEPLCDDFTGEEEVAVSTHLSRETWEALAILAPPKGSYPAQLIRDIVEDYVLREKSASKTPLDLLAQAISAVTTARAATTQGFADDHCTNALKELLSAVRCETAR